MISEGIKKSEWNICYVCQAFIPISLLSASKLWSQFKSGELHHFFGILHWTPQFAIFIRIYLQLLDGKASAWFIRFAKRKKREMKLKNSLSRLSRCIFRVDKRLQRYNIRRNLKIQNIYGATVAVFLLLAMLVRKVQGKLYTNIHQHVISHSCK